MIPAFLPADEHWQLNGACADEKDPEMFFPVGTTSDALIQADEAKAVCHRCPVMETCGQWALNNRIDHGVWGAWTEEERRAILRKRGRGTGSGRKKAL